MKRSLIYCATFAALPMFAAPEAAADIRADNAAGFCEAIALEPKAGELERTYDNGWCRGMFAIVERLLRLEDGYDDPPYEAFSGVCRPLDWMKGWRGRNGIEALVAIYHRYVYSLPVERQQESFLRIVAESMEHAFPCGDEERKEKESRRQR